MYQSFQLNSGERTKEKLISRFPFLNDVSWDKMGSFTTCISDGILNEYPASEEVYFISSDNKKLKKRDERWYNECSVKLDSELRKKINNLKGEIQRASSKEAKNAKEIQEIANCAANYLVMQCREITGCEETVLIIEDLQLRNNFFGGSGKREIGWDNFSKPKNENSWIINQLHKALSNRKYKGIQVIEVNPRYTSQTCPKCSCVNRENRKQEKFRCLDCNFEGHSDLDIAPFNIMRVAMEGKVLRGPSCEQVNAKKKKGGARTTKPLDITR